MSQGMSQPPLHDGAWYCQRERLRQQLMAVYQRGLTQSAPYWDFGWPLLTAAVPELRSGLFYVASPENVGKSMWLVNAGYQILQHNPDALWLDFSLDDSVDKRIGYLMARVGRLPISLVHRAALAEEILKKERQAAFRGFLKEFGARVHLEGSSLTQLDPPEPDVRYTAEYIGKAIEAARAANPAAKLLVTIDGFHDLALEARYQDENDRQRQKSQHLKRVAANEGALIMMSCHCRKESRRRGMSPDVIKGDDSLLYDAEVVAHLYSDVNLNRDNAVVFWFDAAQGDRRLPVHELDLLKNKAGAFKGVLFYNYLPERCWDVEVDPSTQEVYRAYIFSQSGKE